MNVGITSARMHYKKPPKIQYSMQDTNLHFCFPLLSQLVINPNKAQVRP